MQKGNNGGKGGVTNAAVAENIKKPEMKCRASWGHKLLLEGPTLECFRESTHRNAIHA